MTLTSRTRKRFLDCVGMGMAEAEQYGELLCELQRDLLFQVGDLARYAEARWPDKHFQVWPDWASPGMIARCKAVAQAYPKESEREAEATYTVYMHHANKPDRLKLVADSVEAGRTSDEERQHSTTERATTWLLAFDVNYFLHRFWFSGAGVEAAVGVATWIQRTVERLKQKGLSDVVCCFDDRTNHRKTLTEGWEDRYKDRPPKDPELGQQLHLVRELLEGRGFCCYSVEGMEGDDVMASLAKQFPGKVTLVTQDKDCRQCLSDKCNILLDVEWHEDETSGEAMPEYKWLSAKQHTEATGLTPAQWIDYQTIMGDNVDGIKGVIGIGEKGAKDLVTQFGSVEEAIAAAKAEDESIRPKKREALIEFEPKLAVTRQLVTLRTDLPLPGATRV